MLVLERYKTSNVHACRVHTCVLAWRAGPCSSLCVLYNHGCAMCIIRIRVFCGTCATVYHYVTVFVR